jgi:hypothetical protein
MEDMLSCYADTNNAPCHPYKPVPVTMSELTTMLNQLEVEHQKNADFLKNPYPTTETDEFYKQAGIAQNLAHDLSIWESGGLPPAQTDLAHGQEVILYGMSHLHAAVMAWIQVIQEGTYDEFHTWWMECLMGEVVSDYCDCHISLSPTLFSVGTIHSHWSVCFFRCQWSIHSPTHPQDVKYDARAGLVVHK